MGKTWQSLAGENCVSTLILGCRPWMSGFAIPTILQALVYMYCRYSSKIDSEFSDSLKDMACRLQQESGPGDLSRT